MPAEGITRSALTIDLSPRIVHSATVVASPAAAAETTIATLTVSQNASVALGVLVFAYAALTVGTAGTAVTLRIRQTDTAGTVVKSTGAMTATAATLIAPDLFGLDTSPTVPGQVYVLTATVTAATAASTVSAVTLLAVVI